MIGLGWKQQQQWDTPRDHHQNHHQHCGDMNRDVDVVLSLALKVLMTVKESSRVCIVTSARNYTNPDYLGGCNLHRLRQKHGLLMDCIDVHYVENPTQLNRFLARFHMVRPMPRMLILDEIEGIFSPPATIPADAYFDNVFLCLLALLRNIVDRPQLSTSPMVPATASATGLSSHDKLSILVLRSIPSNQNESAMASAGARFRSLVDYQLVWRRDESGIMSEIECTRISPSIAEDLGKSTSSCEIDTMNVESSFPDGLLDVMLG